MNYNNGDIVRNSRGVRVVFDVTEQDLDAGVNAYNTGSYCFYGLWYEGDFTTKSPYGKIEEFEAGEVLGNVNNLSLKEVLSLLEGETNEF